MTAISRNYILEHVRNRLISWNTRKNQSVLTYPKDTQATQITITTNQNSGHNLRQDVLLFS